MFRFHQHGAQASHSFAIALDRAQIRAPKDYRRLRHREMQIALRRSIEDLAGKCGYLADALGARSKDHDVQLRAKRRSESLILLDLFVKNERRRPAAFQPAREFPAPRQRQKLLCRPQRSRRGARPGALQTDLSQMQLRGTEIGVRRIVFVKPTGRRIAKQYAAATVWLQSMLVRIDDDRVRLPDPLEAPRGFLS